MPNVLHFVRKNTQLNASFIGNQISKHINFTPIIIFREYRTAEFDGGFAQFRLNDYNYLDASLGQSILEKFRYNTVKTISNRQAEQILEIIDQYKVSICHFHYGTDCGVYTPLIKRLPIPSVVSFYGYDCSSFPKRFWGFGKTYLKNRVFKHVTKVLAMSPDMQKDLMEAGCPEKKIKVHYYGTDVQLFYLKEKRINVTKTVTILNLCSLVPQKGQLFLLKSIAKVIAKGITNFCLRIVGAGELEEELKTYVAQHKLTNYVYFTGAIPYGGSEMVKEYHEADIFVHPSVIAANGDKEGIPGTIVEAMSAALPVITTYHAGIPHIITNNVTGLLVKEHDVESLSDAIIQMITSPEIRRTIGQTGQDYALEKLNLKKNEIDLENIYQQLIS